MENIDKLSAALVKVQKEMKTAVKDSENPFFRSKYADLSSVWKACHEALSDNGIAVIQRGAFHDGHFFLTTTLVHSSGQSISGEYLIKPVKEDPQAYGSAWTYGRRYSLAAMVGVMADDDDANEATGKPQVTAAVAQTFTKSAPTQASGASFIPKTVSIKNGEGPKGQWTKYGVLSPDGNWFGTFVEEIGQAAILAKDNGKVFSFSYKSDGKYNTIIEVREEAVIQF